MGDKSRKKRPGRESDRQQHPRWLRVDGPHGFFCWVDSESGDMHAVGDGDGIDKEERNRITAEVLELLTAHGFRPRDPLAVRDFLFA